MNLAPKLLSAALLLALAPLGAGADPERDAAAAAARAEAHAARDSARTEARAARDGAQAEARAARAELNAAREELRELTRRIAELSARVGAESGGNTFAFRYLADPDRAMIGVVLGASREGVQLDAVTPGGPAEKAGLKAGDVLVEVNGKAVPKIAATTPGEVVRGESASAVDATRDLIGKLKEGEKVAFKVLRDGKTLNFTPIAERRESWEWPLLAERIELELPRVMELRLDESRRLLDHPEIKRALAEGQRGAVEALRHPETRKAIEDAMRDARRSVIRVRGSGLGDFRLHSLDADLGRYFGADSGVLVLESTDRFVKELKAGDVILSVGGERTEDPRDVMRAFGRQEAGAAINVEVMRDKRRQVIVATVPEHLALGFNFDFDWESAPKVAPPPRPHHPPKVRAPMSAPPPPPPQGTTI